MSTPTAKGQAEEERHGGIVLVGVGALTQAALPADDIRALMGYLAKQPADLTETADEVRFYLGGVS